MEEILKAFGICGNPKPLSGGQNTSMMVGDYVLKPVNDNVEFVAWSLGLIDQLDPRGYRVSNQY